MRLEDELERVAAAGSLYGTVRAVLAAEPASGERSYLVALGDGAEREWLVLDGALEPVAERARVRGVASVVALCELAVELAVAEALSAIPPGRLESASGSEDVLAATELEAAVGAPPRLASPAYLDRVGAASRRLERELGEHGSLFARDLAAHSASVEAFVAEVEGRHRVSLR